VIVRDDVRILGALGNDIRALDPGLQLVEGIEVVVAVAGLLVFREPVLVVAAVKPDVSDRGSRADTRADVVAADPIIATSRVAAAAVQVSGLLLSIMVRLCLGRVITSSREVFAQAIYSPTKSLRAAAAAPTSSGIGWLFQVQ
jgi:hypothetical protein